MNESQTPHVHLSRTQKWDLFRMTAAALVSTGLFATPVVFSDRDHAALPVASARPAQRVERVTSDVTAVTTPDVQRPAARAVRATATRSHPRAERTAVKPGQNPFPKRVVRLIAGDGRYAVRPFPTVEPAER